MIDTIKSIFENKNMDAVKKFFDLPFEYKHLSLEVYHSWVRTYFEIQPNEEDRDKSNYTRITIEKDKLFCVQSGDINYSLEFTDMIVKRLDAHLDDDEYPFIDIYLVCKNALDNCIEIGICIDLMEVDSVRRC